MDMRSPPAPPPEKWNSSKVIAEISLPDYLLNDSQSQ